jgi:hypothetical protein
MGEDFSQQPENCENRNDPDLVHAFLEKWWVESDFKCITDRTNLHITNLLSVPETTNLHT